MESCSEINTRLSASVRALDARNRIYTNNTSFDIWKISPSLKLEVTAPQRCTAVRAFPCNSH